MADRPGVGFTLIELLVVISIIALLVGILLPVLGAARGAGRSAVCLSNLRQAGIGFGSYFSDNKDFIPGPNTSGFAYTAGIAAGSDSPEKAGAADDWVSPILGRGLPLPYEGDGVTTAGAGRLKRQLVLVSSKFRCPANEFRYNGVFPNDLGVAPASQWFYNSYSSPLGPHFANADNQSATPASSSRAGYGSPDAGAITIPANYNFNLNTLGQPSLKVAAMDGARYIKGNSLEFDRNRQTSAFGHNFINRGPTLNAEWPGSGQPYKMDANGELREEAKRYTYRHPSYTINMLFFDGRAANFANAPSRKVDYFFPTGTVVDSTSLIADKTITPNYAVR